MTPAGMPIKRLLQISAGMIVWASALVWLYAGESLACQHIGASPSAGQARLVTALLLAVAVLHLLGLGALLWRWFRRPRPQQSDADGNDGLFPHRLEGLVLALSIPALLWLALPIVLVSPCSV